MNRRELKSAARFVRMWRGVAKMVGLQLKDVRAEDGETGEHFHGFECEGLGIELIDGKWWSIECHHYAGSIYEPPSVDWSTRDSAHASFGDALEWLVTEAHDNRLQYAREACGAHHDWITMKDD